MSKDKIPAAPPKTQTAFSLRRSHGMWIYERAEIPEDVFRRYVVDEKGPDIMAMCAAHMEVDAYKLGEKA